MSAPSVTVSGSFRRHIGQIQADVATFTAAGALVLSPADPRVVGSFGDFVFVASDRLRTVRTVEDRHLQSIKHSAFLWLVAPDGYVGPSTAMELGFAMAVGTPAYALSRLTDVTMRQYVETVDSIPTLLSLHHDRQLIGSSGKGGHMLLDPTRGAVQAHSHIDAIEALLLRSETYKIGNARLSAHARRLREIIAGM